MIYVWAGLPWTLLMEWQYEPIHQMLKDGVKPDPIAVEVLNIRKNTFCRRAVRP